MELTYQNTSKKIQTDIRNHPLPRGGHGQAGLSGDHPALQ